MKRCCNILLSLLICIIVFEGCKKYEQGPTISFRSKKSRVAADWVVTNYSYGNSNWSYRIYGTEYLMCENNGSVQCTRIWQVTSFTMTFEKNGKYNWQRTTFEQRPDSYATSIACSPRYDTIINNESGSGEWYFTSQKAKLKTTNFDINPFYSDYLNSKPETITWEIIELREKHMELKYVYVTTPVILVLDKK